MSKKATEQQKLRDIQKYYATAMLRLKHSLTKDRCFDLGNSLIIKPASHLIGLAGTLTGPPSNPSVFITNMVSL
jgi:hypothetical protein